MAGRYFELMPVQEVDAGFKQSCEEAIDVGAFKELNVAYQLAKQATGGTSPVLVLQHAAVNEEWAYVDIDNTTDLALDGTEEVSAVSVTGFLRWVRMSSGGSFGTAAQAGVRVVAKE